MFHQIRNAADVQPLRLLFAHPDRVGVVESQRIGDADAEFCEPLAQHCDARVGWHVVQQFVGDGAGVFGIGVDVATQ